MRISCSVVSTTNMASSRAWSPEHLGPGLSGRVDMIGLVVDLATNLAFQYGCIDKGRGGVRCEGDAAPGPYSTSTARMLLPGTLGNSRSKIFVTFDVGA